MAFIGLCFHNTIETCLKRVGHGGYKKLKKEMYRFVEDMSLHTHCTLDLLPGIWSVKNGYIKRGVMADQTQCSFRLPLRVVGFVAVLAVTDKAA